MSLSWHVRNPLTGGDSWDVSDSTVVSSILPGGTNYEKFSGWLDKVAFFLNSLKTKDGTKIPVLFRPWHEHTGNWFWWGANQCSSTNYKQLWRMTAEQLAVKGVNNVLYVYSSSSGLKDSCQYLERYPGDDLIDVLGYDAYQGDSLSFINDMKSSLDVVSEVGKNIIRLSQLQRWAMKVFLMLSGGQKLFFHLLKIIHCHMFWFGVMLEKGRPIIMLLILDKFQQQIL